MTRRTFTCEQVTQLLAQIRVVWLVIEPQRAAVLEVRDKLRRESTAEDFNGRDHLLLADLLVLLLLRSRLKALPWQAASQKIHHHVAEGLNVVPATLLDAEVSVDGRIAGGSCEVFVLTVRNVNVVLRVAVLLGEPKIDDVNLVGALAQAHEEVVRFDVAMDETL